MACLHRKKVITARLSGRLVFQPKQGLRIGLLILLLTLPSCALPEVTIEKKQKHTDDAAAAFLSKPDSNSEHDTHAGNDKFLASVHIRFTELGQGMPINFDIHRDKSERVVFKLWETEQTSIYLHFGSSNGPVAGLRFSWRF